MRRGLGWLPFEDDTTNMTNNDIVTKQNGRARRASVAVSVRPTSPSPPTLYRETVITRSSGAHIPRPKWTMPASVPSASFSSASSSSSPPSSFVSSF